jgi:hypothetical protein
MGGTKKVAPIPEKSGAIPIRIHSFVKKLNIDGY